MSVTNIVRMARDKKGLSQAGLAEAMGMTRQSLSNKSTRDSWTAVDLMKVAEITGGKLMIVYPDGQQLLFLPDDPMEEE